MEEPLENNVKANIKPSISNENIQIKVKDIKLEPEITSSDEENSIKEHSSSRTVEFVEIQSVKIEEVDEFINEEDPIKINEGTFICDYCKRAFTTAEYCEKHTRICGVRVDNQPTTTATPVPEEKSRNEEKKLYQCDKCDSTFKSRPGLNQHLRRHSGIGLHTCAECHRQFPSPSLLATHMLIHTGKKPHKCTQCDASFKRTGDVKRHMLTHTGVRAHKCNDCGQSFSQSGHLTQHMRIHTGHRPHQCNLCSKAFTQSGSLLEHLRRHTGEKPYQCNVCNQAFARNDNLSKHMKTHLNKKSNKT